MSSKECFPRSYGTSVPKPSIPVRPVHIPEDEQLFKSRKIRNPIVDPKSKAKRLTKRKKGKNQDDQNGQKSNVNKTVIENLTLARLIEGTVLLGCIQEVSDFEIRFSVTGGIVVTVPITNISTPYTRLIESFAAADDDEDVDVEIPKLSTIYAPGEYYPVKILSKKTCDNFGHSQVIGSINPKDIYQNFSSRTFQKLPEGFPLIAAVISQEDHGYMMDLGSSEIKAFLSFEEVKKHSSDAKFSIGQLVQCCLASQRSERIIALSLDPKMISKFTLDDDHQPGILSYCPGVKVKGLVMNVQNSGLELELPGGYKGFVPRHHISEDPSVSIKQQRKIGETVTGFVLYVHPHTKQVAISLKPMLKKKKVQNLLDSIRMGLIIDRAVVCGRSEFGGLIFRLPNNNFAIAFKKHLFEPSEATDEDLTSRFPMGSTHKCRVRKFRLFDNLIEVSLRKSFIERKELSLDDLELGAVVEGTVKKYRPDGIYVRLAFGINGFIPNIHLTDAPIVNVKTICEKLFPLRKKVMCRIFKLELSGRIPKIALTAKKTLIQLKNEEIFQDLASIRPGMSSVGVVCLFTEKGILLEFFNRVRGFVPLKYLATYKIEHPDKVFQMGQLVKCTAVSVDPSSGRMVCSLIDVDESNKLKQNLKIKHKDAPMNSKLQVGQILKNLKIISKIPMRGLDLTNQQEKIQVFLPIYHLSDDPQMSQMLFSAYQPGETIEKVMVFSKDSAGVVCVTCKPVFLRVQADRPSCLVTKEDDVAVDVPFPVVVRRVTSTGVFFETPNNQCGVVRKKLIQDGFYDEPQALGLNRGQTIFVMAIDVNPVLNDQPAGHDNQLKRFKFSMKLSHILAKQPESIRIQMLKDYIDEFELLRSLVRSETSGHDDRLKQLASYSLGQVVTYVVKEISPERVNLAISMGGSKNEPTVPGIVSFTDELRTLTVSQMGNAIVCDIDYDQQSLVVYLQPSPAKIVRLAKNFSKENWNRVKLGQNIKGTVIHVGERFVLAVLTGHVPGLIAVVQPKKHYNDLRQHVRQLYSVGQSYPFSIENLDETRQRVLAVLAEQKKQTTKQTNKIRTTSESTEPEEVPAVNEPTPEVEKPKPEFAKPAPKIDNPLKKFDWDIPVDMVKLTSQKKRKLEEDEEVDWETMSLDENGSEGEESNTNNKKRKTRMERNEEARQKEIELRKKEAELTDQDRVPKDEQDFEMALLASPNSSLIWIKFMAFFLDRRQFDKAREIGERALSKISFREEKERLNIWISLLNLENNFGDENSMQQLVEKAIRFNDAKTIYSRLAEIYEESDKHEKAEQIYNLMTKKFHSDETVWIDFLLFHMKNGRLDAGRKLFHRALLTLDKRNHVDLISKFAQMEFRYGDREKGKTIFESLLATHWKRLDKWSIYIDMLCKYTLTDENGNQDVDALEFIRNIFERLLTFKFSAHKMRFIFNKYYDFESKYSGENLQVIERLKQKAEEFSTQHGTLSFDWN